jgi:classical protein kinase C/novel protein kinase C epsilon type
MSEIQFKLDVEQKVKAGTERMWQVMQTSPTQDKKRQEQVEDKLAECNAKVAILLKSQHRYQALYFEDDKAEKGKFTSLPDWPCISL